MRGWSSTLRRCALATTLAGAMAAASGCRPEARDADVGPAGLHPLPERVAIAVAAADATPNNGPRQRRAGTALIDATLEGRLELAADAETYLERALALDAHDLTAARKLSRLLNLRLVRQDFSQAKRQIELFDLLRRESNDPYERFVFDCFHQMATAASLRDQGRPLAAVHEVRTLEQRLRQRMETNPAEVETAAMAGNYALAFATEIPVGRKRRLGEATRYFEAQQHGWDAQSVTARGLGTAPGTRSVFALWLAQAELATGRLDEARSALAIVEAQGAKPDATAAMRQLAKDAVTLGAEADQLAGDSTLLPAWPSAAFSCIACHSTQTALPPQPRH